MDTEQDVLNHTFIFCFEEHPGYTGSVPEFLDISAGKVSQTVLCKKVKEKKVESFFGKKSVDVFVYLLKRQQHSNWMCLNAST